MFYAGSRARREVNTCSKLLGSVSATEQHKRVVLAFQSEPNVQTLLVILFIQNIQGLL